MEIIHLILGKANPERMNGVNRVVYQLASQQAASGRKVAVWGITKVVEHNYGKRNFETRLFPAKRNPFAIDDALKTALLSKKGQAVFHLHGGWIPTYTSVSRFLAKHKIPFVLTPHGAYNTIAMQRSRWVKTLYFQLFERFVLRRAKRIHAIGESEVDGLQKIYPNDKSFLTPYGFTAPETWAPTFPKNDRFTIGFIGRLDIHTKGLDLLLTAFQQVQEFAPNVRLWIVGDSEERPVLEKMIESKALENVVLWGSKFGEEKESLLQFMDVFAHPSRNEGLPSAVLEAAGMGIPCIVTRATNVGSFITDYKAGTAVANEDADALAQALIDSYKAWQANRIASMGENAQRMVQEAFDWKRLLGTFDLLYQ